MLEPETVLGGRYRITGVLAQGGMGVVYRAEDERLLRPVAIKTPGRDEEHLVLRLRREARLLARLSHPNIVRLFDVVEHDGQPYLVSELVDGVPLRNLLGEMSTDRIAEVGGQIAAALAAAHALGIIHRDLKPSNVLVADRARLLDFGIARQHDDTTLTTTQGIVGTASYLAPEQLSGARATPASDIYALGLVLIECFSGRSAFPGSLAETVTMRLMGPPELPASMPTDWHPLIEELLDTDPERRPPAGAVAARLHALGSGDVPPALVTGSGPTVAVGAGVDATELLGPASSPVPTPVPRARDASGDTPVVALPLWRRAARRTAIPAAAVAGAVAGSLLVAAIVRPDAPATPAAGADANSPTSTQPVAALVTTSTPERAGVVRRDPATAPAGDQDPAPDEQSDDPATGGPDNGSPAAGGPGPAPGGGGNSGQGGGNGGGGGGNGGGGGSPRTTVPEPTVPPTTSGSGSGGNSGGGAAPTTLPTGGGGLLNPVTVVLDEVDHTVDQVVGLVL